jgi:hypothetical protein
MNAAELTRRLASERIVSLGAAEWAAVADAFQELERHATGFAGDLVLVKGEGGLAAVEQSSPQERVVRALADASAARRFVEERLEVYERMWDGCGCKVDYHAYQDGTRAPGGRVAS